MPLDWKFGQIWLKFHNTSSRFANEQLGDVSKVLLDGLYDAESPLSKLCGNYLFMKDIWEMVTQDRWAAQILFKKYYLFPAS